MRYKVLVSSFLFPFMAGLFIYLLIETKSMVTASASVNLFIKYLIGIGIGCGLFLIIDILIGVRNIPGYFKKDMTHNISLITIFMMIMILPLIGLLLGIESNFPNYEKRTMAAIPSLSESSIVSFPNNFNNYFNDNFGFRKTWMNQNNYMKVNYFKISGIPDVVLGKNGWLFYKWSIDDTMGLTSFTLDQLVEIKNNIEHQTKWLADRGIYYLFVIAPNKEIIYPEYLPGDINPAQKITKIDQFMACFEANPNVHILDLRDTLLKAKMSDQVYYRTDTHWNNYGAWVGYREIIKQLSVRFPELSMPSIADYIIQDNAYMYSGDLVSMLSLNDQLTETAPRVTLKDVSAENSGLRKAVIFRDSFYGALEPYFTANFEELANISPAGQFDYKTLEDNPPDLVMTICVQRQISYMQSSINNWLPVK